MISELNQIQIEKKTPQEVYDVIIIR